MAIPEIIEVKYFNKKKEEAVKACAKQLDDELIRLFNLFNREELIEQIIFTQYSPHFADGDLPVFSVHVEEPCYKLFDDIEKYYSWETHGENPKIDKILDNFVNEVIEIPDEVFFEAYGNHIEVIVSKDKVETDFCEHD